MYGYSPRQNSSFDMALESLVTDAEVFGVQVYSSQNVARLIEVLSEKIDGGTDTKGESSMAVIGLVEHFIQHQVDISDQLVRLFNKACSIEPYRSNKERVINISTLKKSLESYMQDSLVEFNRH
ncbi:hypothetical protein VCHA53O466_40354 [Vibrio chagasii]|nr:hypothetical protein VCHA53O466_40354 [Vibrio chagasii]